MRTRFLALLIPVLSFATGIDPDPRDPPSRKHEALGEYLTAAAAYGYSGVVLVADRDGVILERGYGFADRAQRQRNDPSIAFDLGSLSKMFTAAAILTLVYNGSLRLTDSLAHIFPDTPVDKRAITVAQLIAHTSGLRLPYGARAVLTRDEPRQRIMRAPLRFAHGSRTEYSNAGYVILAAIVQQVSGESFTAYVTRRLFAKAGMTRTGFRGALPATLDGAVAHGYDELGELVDPARWDAGNTAWLGAEGAVSTASDLRRWFDELRGGRIMPLERAQTLLTPLEPDSAGGGYAFGLRVDRTTSNQTVIAQSGDPDGYGSRLAWYPEHGVLLVSLCNIRHDLYPTHTVVEDALERLLLGAEIESPPAPRQVAATTTLSGVFQLDDGSTFIVDTAQGELRLGAIGQRAIDVLAGGDSAARAARAQLTRRTSELLSAWKRGDTMPMSEALGRGGDAADFGRAMAEEMLMRTDHREVTDMEVVGTYPGGGPYGVQSTLVRLHSAGVSATYRIKWLDDIIWDSGPRAPAAAAELILQPIGARRWVGWDLIHPAHIEATLAAGTGGADTLTVINRTAHTAAVAQRGH